jgi:hypothetical protein
MPYKIPVSKVCLQFFKANFGGWYLKEKLALKDTFFLSVPRVISLNKTGYFQEIQLGSFTIGDHSVAVFFLNLEVHHFHYGVSARF